MQFFSTTASGPEPEPDPPRPVWLRPEAMLPGAVDGRTFDLTFWVWPLPPPGPLTFVCEWPAHGVPESTADLDGALVRDAAARAVDRWPSER